MKYKNKLTGEEFSSFEDGANSAKTDPMITILGILSEAMESPNKLIDWLGSEDFSSGDKSAAARILMQVIQDLKLKYMVVYMTHEELEPLNRIRVCYKLIQRREDKILADFTR